LPKDKRDGEQINEVFVYQKERNLTEDEAVEYINQCLIEDFAEFEQIYLEIKDEPVKKAYADGLRHWIIGHEEWGRNSLRYQENKEKKVQKNIELEQIDQGIFHSRIEIPPK